MHLNILAFSNTLWSYGSGGELATYHYATSLRMKGFETVVIVRDRNVLFKPYDFKVSYLPCIGSGKYSLYVGRKLLEKFIKWADVVYFASTLWNFIPLAKRFGKPVVAHIHSYDPVCPVGSLYNFVTAFTCSPGDRICSRCAWLYERSHGRSFMRSAGSMVLNSFIGQYFTKLLGYADALIFVSYAHRNLFMRHLRAVLGSSVPRSYVIYNPIPNIRYSKPREMNVGYFGGFSPLKGYHVVQKAWTRVLRRHHDRKLFMTKMGRLTGSSILRKMNVFAYERLGLSELEHLWSRIGVVVFPSIWQEPFGYAVIETLLYGRLLIASHIGGVPEIVVNAPGVKLIPPNDVNSLVDALDWALSMDPRDAVELGLKNREYILRRLDNERSVRELIKVFESVLHR